MQLTFLDWAVIAAYFLFNIGIGLYYKSRAGTSISEYFLSGRNVPWWLAGTSMVATTFAADTPLAVTGMVARDGIAGNWLWWCFIAGGMMTVFFYARLWRRSKVMTDIEFSEIRYSGRPAAFLRGFRALYLGIPINCIILGWVNLAMVKILQLILGITQGQALLGRARAHRVHLFHLHALRAMGRAGDRSVPVRHQDGNGDCVGRGAVNAVGGIGRDEGQTVGAGCRAPSPERGTWVRLEFCSGSRFGMDAADYILRLHLHQLVGDVVSRR